MSKKKNTFLLTFTLRQTFLSVYGDRWQTANAYSFNNDFAGSIEKQMDHFNNTSTNKIEAVNQSMQEVRGVMVENIEKVTFLQFLCLCAFF